MAFIHVYNYSYAPVPGSAVSGSVSLTADSETSVDEAIAVANDQLINIAIDVSEIQGFIIKSDKDCEVYTNDTSGGSPDDNISLTANVPVIFFDGGPLANPFASNVDVTKIYVDSAAVGTLQIRVLQDPTP